MKSPTSQNRLLRLLGVLSIPAVAIGFTACDVKKTQEGEMPKVNVEGGQMPKYDVDPADVRVEQEKKTITVPDIDIVTEEEKKKGGNIEPGETTPESSSPAPSESAPAPATENQ